MRSAATGMKTSACIVGTTIFFHQVYLTERSLMQSVHRTDRHNS
jgi:hypothetical protein